MNRRDVFATGAAILLALLMTPIDVAASCIATTSCRVFEMSSVVVQGTVTDVTDVNLGTDTIGGRAYPRTKTLVTIDVEKAWKGATPGTPVQIYTDGPRTSTGLEFVRGKRYVVFAGEWGGLLQTSICQHTNPIEKAGEDLAFLDTLSRPESGARVYGRITFDQRGFDTADTGTITPRAVSGRRVSLKGPSGAGARDVVTNEDGRYQIEGLPTGAYELDVDLPDGWDRRGLPRTFTLETLRGCEEVNISTAIDGRLSGQIVGADGRPLRSVRVDAAPLEALRRNDGFMTSLAVMTNVDGRFDIHRLPPGRYIVGIHLTRAADNYAPYRFTAYPGTTQTETATTIALDTAQQLDLGVLTVPRVQTKRAVHGRVAWADGRLLLSSPRIIVTEVRPDWGGPEVRTAGPIRVDGEGRFTVELYEGVSYRFVAEAPLVRPPSALSRSDGAAAGTGAGRGAFSFGADAVSRVRSKAVDVTVSGGGDLPIVSLVLDESSAAQPF